MSFQTIARRAAALACVATLLGSPAPTGAAAPSAENMDPEARIHIVVKQVRIFDDRDPGDGEMRFEMVFGCVGSPTTCFGRTSINLDIHRTSFDAGEGETVLLDQVLPQPSELTSPEYGPSREAGYPLYRGHRYQIFFRLTEYDDFGSNERLGERWIWLSHENGWGIGTHRLRSTRRDGSGWGDYEIEFEVRKAALPDLRPVNLTVHDQPGSASTRICTGLVNSEVGDAGPFEVALEVDGVVPPGGRAAVPGLASGGDREVCVEMSLPTAGQHKLAARVDAADVVPEYNETNNVYEQPYVAVQAAPASSQP